MPVISAYSTSGSSYISPSSYRFKSSLTDRRSYTTSSSSSAYRRGSYRYDLPSYSSAYSYRSSDRSADTELSASLSTLATVSSSTAAKDTTKESSSSAQTTTTTVNQKDSSSISSRPSRYSTAYSSYSSLSTAPTRDYSSRSSVRSSDRRYAKDLDNNCVCAGGATASSSYVSNLRSTALSGADIYQKYGVSTYKPSSIIASSSLKASSPSVLDTSKVNKTSQAKDKNSNFDAVIVASINNNPTNTNGTSTSVINSLLEINCKPTAANNNTAGPKPASTTCFLSAASETSASGTSVTATTITTTTTTTITTTTSSTSVLLSSSSSSSALYDTTTTSAPNAALVRKPGTVIPPFKSPRVNPGYVLSKPQQIPTSRPPVPKSAFPSNPANTARRELLGLSGYRNQNFLKNECDLVKRELSKSATDIAFKRTSSQSASAVRPTPATGSTNSLLQLDANVDEPNRGRHQPSYLTKLETIKVKPFLPPVSSYTSGDQPKDHEDDDMKHHHHHYHHHHNNQHDKTRSSAEQSPSASTTTTTNTTTTAAVELKPIDRPCVTTSYPASTVIAECTQKNATSLFKSSSPSTPTTPPTTTTTTTTESLTTASSCPSSTCTYNTNNSRSADAMKSLHVTTELEESITQATIKLRPSLNGTSTGSPKFVATASTTTDDLSDGDYHVTATIRIKPKSSITHSTSSSSSSSTNGSPTTTNNNSINGSISNNNNNNNNNNANDGDNSSGDERDVPNGPSKNGLVNNNNEDDESGSNSNSNKVNGVDATANVGANSVDKEPNETSDDERVSYLRAGTASKGIHSTSPLGGYRVRDYEPGIGSSISSYHPRIGSTSSALAKSSYDRAGNDDVSSRKEGLCGLWNIGNTCFMNSVIQCLSHTRELTSYLRNQPTTERGTSKEHKILSEYTKLIKEMWNGTQRSVNPSELKYAFSNKHRMYSGSAQQDAQEFLRFFIDSLHIALNVSVKREPISRALEDDDLNNRIKATMMWEWYSTSENSVIKDLFVGLLRSTLKCTVCNGASVTFDPFWDLSLPLPSTNSRCKLENCLDMFVKEEVMDGIDQPTCSRCKTRRKCTKSLTIERFPKYLVIHLKRFSETRWSKLTNIIEFPTGERQLNLQPYASEDNTGPVYYSLYGISNHMGSTAGGHYIAACKHPISKEWNEFNDNFVSETSERSLVTSSAYVLFYERA